MGRLRKSRSSKRPMFEQAFKNIDDVLWKEAGCTTELDYTEQTSWLLFLKYLDGLEQDNERRRPRWRARSTAYILDKPYRWGVWAAPKEKDGTLDHNKAHDRRRPQRLRRRRSSFPTCTASSRRAERRRTRSNTRSARSSARSKTRFRSGYNLREIIDHIDELRFRSQTEKHELSHLYEAKIKQHGQRRAQRRRVLHAAPAHPRHGPGGQAADRRAHLRRRRRLGRLPVRSVRLPEAQDRASSRPRTSRRSRSGPSTARRRSPSPTSSRS